MYFEKRANAIDPCDPGLENEDNKIRHTIMNSIGCIPAFSRLFLNQSLLHNDSSLYPACSKVQYRKIYKLYGNVLQTKDWYVQPCTSMNTIVTMTDPVAETSGFRSNLFIVSRSGLRIDFTLKYLTESYRETINKKAFDMATLWSQVGGFIGMFLGYSLLQVPELAKNLFQFLKSFL